MIKKMVKKDPDSRTSLKDIINKYLKPMIDSPVSCIQLHHIYVEYTCMFFMYFYIVIRDSGGKEDSNNE